MEANVNLLFLFLQMVGFFLIWVAVDYKRPEEFQFSLFSKDGIVQLVLITIAGILLTNFN